MSGRVLLKGIYMSMFEHEKKINDISTIETVIEQDNEFWDIIEKIAITTQNTEEYACWNCCLLYTTKTWGIPIFTFTDVKIQYQVEYKLHHNLLSSINKSEFNNIKTLGHFCSIVCAVRYLDETIDIPRNNKEGYKNLLYFAYSQYCGQRVLYIPPSHPRNKMRIYCGPGGWSEQEYREHNKALESNIILK